ncbi:MAG: hypothetical protein KatS3mg010_1852 [Acidimicrobiia bacterium]|nr:MAG: hypothetical protein KatS3mg010_1852 [Acidimicrobiia bacterium]
MRTAEPTRSTTPDASEPITWYGWSCRLPHTLSRPRRVRNWNVDTGSKIDVHTVLKLIALAITATYASSGASSGSANFLDVDRLARILLLRGESGEHLGLVRLDERAAHRLGQRQVGQLLTRRPGEDRVTDGVDLGHGTEATGR